MTFNLGVSNTGQLRATNLEIRILRPTDNQFAGFPVAQNPPGLTTGDQAVRYEWQAVGDAASPDGQVSLGGLLQSGETVSLSFTLFLAPNYAPGDTLRVTSSLVAGGCGD